MSMYSSDRRGKYHVRKSTKFMYNGCGINEIGFNVYYNLMTKSHRGNNLKSKTVCHRLEFININIVVLVKIGLVYGR